MTHRKTEPDEKFKIYNSLYSHGVLFRIHDLYSGRKVIDNGGNAI